MFPQPPVPTKGPPVQAGPVPFQLLMASGTMLMCSWLPRIQLIHALENKLERH